MFCFCYLFWCSKNKIIHHPDVSFSLRDFIYLIWINFILAKSIVDEFFGLIIQYFYFIGCFLCCGAVIGWYKDGYSYVWCWRVGVVFCKNSQSDRFKKMKIELRFTFFVCISLKMLFKITITFFRREIPHRVALNE